MTLRSSQIETLQAVRDLHAESERASPFSVAVRQRRGGHATEASLIRLAELGYLVRLTQPLLSSSYALTDQGRAVLLEEGR